MTTLEHGRKTSFRRSPHPSPTSAAVRGERLADPGFGRFFTDHMVSIRWKASKGWHDACVGAHTSLELPPAAMVLHYGQSIFEGLKAYRQPDGDIALFRLSDHARRFQRSAERMAMPPLPVELFAEACRALIDVDESWVPASSGHALYLRPVMFASEPHLGVRSAREFCLFVIASPVAPYLCGDARSLDVVLGGDDVRAAPGGVGAAKSSTNYAASLLTRERAIAAGYDEVLWLDAIEHHWVEELSAMNIFFVRSRGTDVTLTTPPLSDTILAGITRDSLLALGRRIGFNVEERRMSIVEWRSGAASGQITEAFGCGTGAVIAPVGRVTSGDESWTMRDAHTSPVAHRLREMLLDIQEGRAVDVFGWRE